METEMKVSQPDRHQGRPPLGPDEGRRSVLNARITTSLRAKIEMAAAEAGRSLSHEIELRLEDSFRDETAIHRAVGGKSGFDLLYALGVTAATVGRGFGKIWWRDPEMFDASRRLWGVIFDAVAKGLDESDPEKVSTEIDPRVIRTIAEELQRKLDTAAAIIVRDDKG